MILCPLFLFKSTLFVFIFQRCEFWSHRGLHGTWNSSLILWLWWVLAVVSSFTLLGSTVLPLRRSEILVLTSIYTYIIKVDKLKENVFQAMLATRKNQWLMWGTQVSAINSCTSKTFSPTVLPEGCPECNRSALQRSIDCLVEQYESYSLNVNGTFTLLENTADTGGLAVAYQVLWCTYFCNVIVSLRNTRSPCCSPLPRLAPAPDFLHTCASGA